MRYFRHEAFFAAARQAARLTGVALAVMVIFAGCGERRQDAAPAPRADETAPLDAPGAPPRNADDPSAPRTPGVAPPAPRVDVGETRLSQDFPRDFPVLEHTRMQTMRATDQRSTSFVLSLWTTLGVDQAADWYEDQLPRAGYAVTSTLMMQGQRMIGFERDGEADGAVVVGTDAQSTVVSITLQVRNTQ